MYTKELITEIVISASPSRVWQVLTDFEKHAEWNPFMTKVNGKDEKLDVTVPNPQGGTMVISPTILAVENERELGWLGKSEGDAFNSEHSLLIKPTGDNSVHFTHSEKSTGSMVAGLDGWLDTIVHRHFDEMKSPESKGRTELVFLSSVTGIKTGRRQTTETEI